MTAIARDARPDGLVNGALVVGRRRIAHALPLLTPGGAERVAVELARHAALAGHAVTLILAHPSETDGHLRQRLPESVELAYVSPRPTGRLTRYLRALSWMWRRRRWLAELDVLHCHLTYGAFVGSLVYMGRGVSGRRGPLVLETYHAVGMRVSRAARRLHALMAAWRDVLVLMARPDAFWAAFIARHPTLPVRTILNGAVAPAAAEVGDERRRTYRREIGIPDACRVVMGTVSMLRPDRQPALYVPVFEAVARALGPDVHFVVAGGGSERERLTALVAARGLASQVHFTGLVAEPRLPLAVMDLYLTTNVGEVTGVAALEAALAGLPVIALQFVPGYDARAGDWIWSSDDAAAIAARAVALLKDEGARRALAERQQRHADAHHSVEAMARAYEALYEASLDESHVDVDRRGAARSARR